MEYIFGTAVINGETIENVKTVGAEHTDFLGYTQLQRSYTDCNITDSFNALRKYGSDEDSEGNCYDWYIIDQHYRNVDYSPKHEAVFSSLLGASSAQAAEQARKVLQQYAAGFTEEQAMEVAFVYPPYEVGRSYTANEYLSYGKNSIGDPQLYRVVQDHTSQADWLPSETPALYAPIGVTEEGFP